MPHSAVRQSHAPNDPVFNHIRRVYCHCVRYPFAVTPHKNVVVAKCSEHIHFVTSLDSCGWNAFYDGDDEKCIWKPSEFMHCLCTIPGRSSVIFYRHTAVPQCCVHIFMKWYFEKHVKHTHIVCAYACEHILQLSLDAWPVLLTLNPLHSAWVRANARQPHNTGIVPCAAVWIVVVCTQNTVWFCAVIFSFVVVVVFCLFLFRIHFLQHTSVPLFDDYGPPLAISGHRHTHSAWLCSLERKLNTRAHEL